MRLHVVKMRHSHIGNILENLKAHLFTRPLVKARSRFFSERDLEDPKSDRGKFVPNNNAPDRELLLQEGNMRIHKRTSFLKSSTKSWKEMYFVLADSRLFCYRQKDDEKPKQVIILDESVGIYPEDVHESTRTSFCIKLTAKHSSYTFCASTEGERDVWLTMMLTVISEKLLMRSASRQNLRYSMY